jgi:hypothetical protein
LADPFSAPRDGHSVAELLAAEPATPSGIKIGYARVSTDGQNLVFAL